MAIGSPAPQAQPGQLVDIGTVAAANIAKAINAPDAAVPVIRNAIRDEIGAMSSHFTLAISDVQTGNEAELLKLKAAYAKDVAEIKAAFSFVKSNKALVIGTLAFAALLGAVVARLV